MKYEQQFSTIFRRWAKTNLTSCAIEIKHTRGKDSFIMSELKEHQRNALLAVRSRHGFAYKISDEGIAHKPFDMFVFNMASAWVVICYPNTFVMIDIVKLLEWTQPSLTVSEAKRLASLIRPISCL